MNIEEKLTALPDKPGVYLFKSKDGKVLYIGKAIILRNRVRSYFQKSRPLDPRLQILVGKVTDIEWIVTDSEIEALILEANLIKKHKPRYNVNLKDDKSFPFIRIIAEDFPQVFPTRRIIRDGSTYFGPYTNVRDMREALTTLKRLFTIRTCKYDLNEQVVAKKKVQLCLQYYIKRCLGPCQGLQVKEDYGRMIDKVKQFLKGKTNQLLSELQQEMSHLAEQQQFEDAARIRDKI
jgi:excinuclease ABC subunit C